jgi:RHS repeat-associated protein
MGFRALLRVALLSVFSRFREARPDRFSAEQGVRGPWLRLYELSSQRCWLASRALARVLPTSLHAGRHSRRVLLLAALFAAGISVAASAGATASRLAGGPGGTTTTPSNPGGPKGKPLPFDPTVTTIAPVCGDQDGSESPVVTNCAQYSQVVDRRYYQVPGSGAVTVHSDYVYKDAGCDNQLAVFKVDDASGSINGVLPGDPTWPTQVSSRNPQVLFGSGSNPATPDVNLTFQGGDILALRFTGCGTFYYSFEQANTDGFDHLLVFQNTAGEPWQFAWEDASGGGDKDFNDMIVNISAPGGVAGTLSPDQSWGTTGGGGINALAPTHAFADAVNSLTGAFTIAETDLATPGLGVSFAMTRSYTSADPASARLGPGWTDSFSASLAVQPNGDVLVHGEDGQRVFYTKQPDGTFVGAAGALSTLTAITGGYKLVRHDQVAYLFNASGVLQSELDRNGQGLSFTYNGAGQLTGVTDATNRAATLTYTNSLLSSVSTSDGRTVGYGYTNGYLTSVTLPDPDGAGPLTSPVTHYTYDPAAGNRLATEIDPNQHTVITNVYDASSGRVTQQTDANSKTTNFAWDASTSTATVTDPDQHAWKDVYQNNVLIKGIDPGGDTTQFSYGPGLDTGSVTAPDGSSTTTLTYDNHNLKTATAPPSLNSVQKTLTYNARNDVVTVTDARTKLTSYGYDPAGNNNSITLDGQQVFGVTYNSQGQMLTSTDGNTKTTNYTYDPNGNLASVTDPLGNKTTYTYSGAGLVLTKVDPLGNCSGCSPANFTTSYTYDAEGRLLVATDPLGHTNGYVYDAAGNKTSETDPNGHTTTYQYDNANRLTTITAADPDGNGPLVAPITSYTYDAVGNRITMVDPLGNCSGCNAAAHTTSYGYDANNRLISTITPLGSKTTYAYDTNGNLASTVDPRGNCSGCTPANYTTSYTYNAAGWLLTTTDPLNHASANTYDPVGNLASVTDANNHTTGYTYNAAGRIVTVTAPDTGTTAYTYDGNGNVLTRTDANNHATSYTYDGDSRQATMTLPDPDGTGPLTAPLTSYGYDGNSNLATTSKPGGGMTTYGYDHAGRRTNVGYSDTTHAISYSYDAVGNRTSMSDAAGTVTYSFDALNRRTGVTRGTDSFAYTYDAASNLLSRSYPGNISSNYTYDADGRLATVTSGGRTTGYVYDPAGNLTQSTLPTSNGYVETRTYDANGRVTEIKTSKGLTDLNKFDYTYDAVGNPTTVTNPKVLTGRSTYRYDANDRNISICYGTDCFTNPNSANDHIYWNYDKVGNRIFENRYVGVNDTSTSYTYDTNDRLTTSTSTCISTNRSCNGSANSTTMNTNGYDAAGNETVAGAATYVYNVPNQMTSSISGGTTTSYSYDGDGNRLQSSTGTANSKKTNHLWDINNSLPQLAIERDGGNNVLRSYIYGRDLLAMNTGGNAYFFHADSLGSIVNITSSTGVTEWTYVYDPFGTPSLGAIPSGVQQNDNAAPANLVRFTGQYLDPTGLYNLRSRQYDPVTGRFLTLDPVSSAQQPTAQSRYGYAGDQPTVMVDPSGETFLPYWDEAQRSLASALTPSGSPIGVFEQEMDRPHFSITGFFKGRFEYAVYGRWINIIGPAKEATLTVKLQWRSNGGWLNMGASTRGTVPSGRKVVAVASCRPGTTRVLRGQMDTNIVGRADTPGWYTGEENAAKCAR